MHPWSGILDLPRRVWLLCGCTLVNRMGTMAFPFLALYLVQGRHWTPQAAGSALLVYGAGNLAAAPFSGRLADRIGHGVLMRASLWGSGAMLLALPLAASPPVLSGAILLWALLTQAFWPSSMALLSVLVPPRQRRAVFALHRLATNLGMAVGPALGGFIAMAGFRWVFWVDGLTTLASAALLTLLFRSGEAVRRPDEEGGSPAGIPAWKDLSLVLLLLSCLPVLMVFSQSAAVLPLWLVRDLHFTTRFFGLVFTLNTLMIVVLEVALNLAMARWPHGSLLALGALLFAVGYGLTGLTRTAGGVLLTVAIWTFGEMIMFPALADAVAALSPPRRRGEYMGMFAFTFALGTAVGPWLGVLAYTRGGPGLAWGGCFVLGCASAAALARFRAPRPSEAPEDAP